jgi:hypothetical protein
LLTGFVIVVVAVIAALRTTPNPIYGMEAALHFVGPGLTAMVAGAALILVGSRSDGDGTKPQVGEQLRRRRSPRVGASESATAPLGEDVARETASARNTSTPPADVEEPELSRADTLTTGTASPETVDAIGPEDVTASVSRTEEAPSSTREAARTDDAGRTRRDLRAGNRSPIWRFFSSSSNEEAPSSTREAARTDDAAKAREEPEQPRGQETPPPEEYR